MTILQKNEVGVPELVETLVVCNFAIENDNLILSKPRFV